MDRMVPEARLEETEHGLAPKGEGWFVVNARDAEWWFTETRGARCAFDNEYGDPPIEFDQLGINLTVLESRFGHGRILHLGRDAAAGRCRQRAGIVDF